MCQVDVAKIRLICEQQPTLSNIQVPTLADTGIFDQSSSSFNQMLHQVLEIEKTNKHAIVRKPKLHDISSAALMHLPSENFALTQQDNPSSSFSDFGGSIKCRAAMMEEPARRPESKLRE